MMMLRLLIVLCLFFSGLTSFTIPLVAHKSTRKGSRLLQQSNALNYTISNLDDYQYYAEIYVGTPAVKHRALIDTGSKSLMLSNTGCSGCPATTRFDVSASSSVQENVA